MKKSVFGSASQLLLLVQLLGAQSPGERGSLTGVIINLANGSMIPGVEVQLEPAALQTTTDLDGMFSFSLPPGEYSLRVSHDGFVEYQVTGISVRSGKATFQDVALNPLGMQMGETTVVADAERASVTALLAERKTASTVSDSIGSQEMSRLAGSNAADVMSRVTGISIVDNRFVYVRGLGERYSNTMLNGAMIPSTQPDKKVVPLDLFPSSLLENIRTEKTYTPDQPGEFSGGIVKIQTVDFPRTRTFRVSYGQGFGTNTTFQKFLNYPGGRWDWLGFDDGTRALPSNFPAERIVRATRFSTSGFEPEELQGFGRSLANVWSPSTDRSAIPDQSASVVFGNTIGRFGFVAALAHSNKFHTRRELQSFFKVGLDQQVAPFHDYEFDLSSRSVRTGVTGSLAYEISKNHRVQHRSFYVKDASDEARIFEGFNGDLLRNIRNIRLRFVEEGVYSGQVAGQHYLNGLSNSFIEWRLNYSRSSLDEPDLREVLYEERNDVFVLANQSQSGLRMFNFLDENLWEPAVDFTNYFNVSSISGNVKFGGSYRSRDRNFSSRRFRFTHRDTESIDLSLPPEQLFQLENISPNGLELREETRPTDAYEGAEINRAAYGMADIAFRSWRFVGGARVESNAQRIETFDLFDRLNPSRITTVLRNTDLLPAASVIYRATASMNLRASFSETLNRPEFRELSPFEFTDVVGGRAVVGNPELIRSRIRNYDMRWEWFVSPVELLSASFFYKNFDSPIERFVEPTAQLRTSYLNADSARNMGFEVDVRKGLGFLSDRLSDFSINSNYTFVDSEIRIPEQELNVLTSLSRPLAGQSRHVFNGILEYSPTASGAVTRLMFNYQGDRISDVGSLGLPDILQDGVVRMDAIFIQPFREKWSLKISAENLMNPAHRFLQGDQVQREFKLGRNFSISVSRSFTE
ncbi:MAG TPA: TonB-dependent receptor [Acidobacteriota bacterium]|nr:TonB-dependent receptor [Acidobacteriota bacterium]